MREYLYPGIVADKCFQYVDDLCTAANTFDEFVTNLKAFFCIEKAGLMFFPSKCEFGLKEMTFLGNTVTNERMQQDKKKVTNFLSTLEVRKTPKQIRRFIGFFQSFRAFTPNSGSSISSSNGSSKNFFHSTNFYDNKRKRYLRTNTKNTLRPYKKI